ncbi:sensor histidine kinase [Saliterribacillus persicus]|uniref:histidine kinase n=1 Tax=Saliterribacillus persicus TaxID=930114 RepID=A0A368Y3W4_9BACI|nr:sensor histidine kinase [Saliterribacillus persicus]RCW74882.1 two-component system sensor histidine kinase YesM [Saliterribacillus persicus]
MLKKLNQLSLRSRLTIAVILCILLPWISTYIVSNYLTKDVLEERAVKQSTDTLSMIEMGINSLFDDIMYTSNYIQFDTGFSRLLKSQQAIPSDSENFQQQSALIYLRISEALNGITDLLSPAYITLILDDDLAYTNYSTIEHDPSSFKQEPWFQELDQLSFYETKWIGAHPTYIESEKETASHLISIARTIKEGNQTLAYLVISMEEKEVSALLNNFQNNTNNKYYLTNQDGEIYSSLNSDDIGKKLSYNVLNRSSSIVDFESEDHLMVSAPVSYSRWRLVSLVPYEETIGSINTVTRTTIIIQGAFLLLFLAGLIVLVREATKPLSRLNLITESVKRGNLKVRANIKGNNDVAALGQSFDHMLDTIEEMVVQVKEQEEKKRTAELEMLQAQINPHFLFNVLNAIRLKIRMNGDKDSAELIYALSALLRMTINRNNAFVPLNEEISVVKHYMQLMNFRHHHDLSLNIEVDEALGESLVPRFFLQPMIENAIIHGYKHTNGVITIKATSNNNLKLILEIIDDGIGMEKEKLQQLKTKIFQNENNDSLAANGSFNGIGVENVFQRLKMIYGNEFDLNIESKKDKGTKFTFYIPLNEE